MVLISSLTYSGGARKPAWLSSLTLSDFTSWGSMSFSPLRSHLSKASIFSSMDLLSTPASGRFNRVSKFSSFSPNCFCSCWASVSFWLISSKRSRSASMFLSFSSTSGSASPFFSISARRASLVDLNSSRVAANVSMACLISSDISSLLIGFQDVG